MKKVLKVTDINEIMKFGVMPTPALAIDGRPLDCVKKTLEQAGCTEFRRVRTTDLGMEKGKAPLTEQDVQAVVSAAQALLA